MQNQSGPCAAEGAPTSRTSATGEWPPSGCSRLPAWRRGRGRASLDRFRRPGEPARADLEVRKRAECGFGFRAQVDVLSRIQLEVFQERKRGIQSLAGFRRAPQLPQRVGGTSQCPHLVAPEPWIVLDRPKVHEDMVVDHDGALSVRVPKDTRQPHSRHREPTDAVGLAWGLVDEVVRQTEGAFGVPRRFLGRPRLTPLSSPRMAPCRESVRTKFITRPTSPFAASTSCRRAASRMSFRASSSAPRSRWIIARSFSNTPMYAD